MARYIDADALTEHIQKLKVVTDDWFGMGIARGIERAETAIQMQPTADVVPRSEVAEIFEEIEKLTNRWLNEADYSVGEFSYDLTELKEKYIGGQDDST